MTLFKAISEHKATTILHRIKGNFKTNTLRTMLYSILYFYHHKKCL